MKSKEVKTRICNFGLNVKEIDGEFYSEGFIATSHPDRAADADIGVNGDILSKHVLGQIADYINNGVASTDGVGSTRAVSLQHDWVKEKDPSKEPAGMAMPPAEIKETKDGHFGVHVKTHHNKTHPKFQDILYKTEHGYFPGYSIEYAPGDYDIINHEGKFYRFLKTINNFVGYAFASARLIANPSATITSFGYKEIEAACQAKETEDTMSEEEIKQPEAKVEDPIPEVKPEEPKEEPKEEIKEVEEAKEEKVKGKIEDLKEKVEEKEIEIKETEIKETEIKETVEEAQVEIKEKLDEVKIESKTLLKGEEIMENINIKQMNEALKENDLFSYKEAAKEVLNDSLRVKETIELFSKVGQVTLSSNLKVKCVDKGLKIVSGLQTKDTLGTGDNTSSYTQADVEFADLFAPGIIDTFNNQTNLFGFLKKEQHIGGEHYQWKMVTNKDPNSTSTFVGHNDTAVTKNFSNKGNYQTPLKIARRGISVTDFVNRYSARSLGDLFQLEADLQMKKMMNDVNAALFAEVADGTGTSPLGLEAVADSAGNTTLYGYTRSVANRLAPDAAGNTYTAVGGSLTEALIRAKITNLETEGTRFGDIAIIASPNSRDLLFNLLDGQRRFNTVEASFGFNRANVPSYDGIPIIVDSDCNSDALYFIDTSCDVIVVGMEPQLISLAKVGAATEAYVQMDFAHVYKEPRKIGMLDTLA